MSKWVHRKDVSKEFCSRTGAPIPDRVTHYIYADGGTCLAVLSDYKTDPEANGKLIAAAPEMLEALKSAHLEIISLLNYGDFKTNVTLDLGYLVDAIAKAEGQTNE